MSNFDVDMFEQDVDEKTVDLYYNHRSSILRGFNQCVEEIKQLKLSKNLTAGDLDSHAEIRDLPNTDLIMLKGISCYDDEKLLQFSFMIGVSTINDQHGIRLSKIMSYVNARYFPGRGLKVIDFEGNKIGALNIKDGTEISPMSNSEGRMFQFITVECNSTCTLL